MKNYVLMKRDDHDYSTIESPVFIFDDTVKQIPNNQDVQLAEYRLMALSETIEDGDTILPTGPSWLIMLLGKWWYRSDYDQYDTHNIRVFRGKDKQYCTLTTANLKIPQ